MDLKFPLYLLLEPKINKILIMELFEITKALSKMIVQVSYYDRST